MLQDEMLDTPKLRIAPGQIWIGCFLGIRRGPRAMLGTVHVSTRMRMIFAPQFSTGRSLPGTEREPICLARPAASLDKSAAQREGRGRATLCAPISRATQNFIPNVSAAVPRNVQECGSMHLRPQKSQQHHDASVCV